MNCKICLLILFLISGTLYAQNACTQSAVVNVAAAATGELVAPTPGRTVDVCAFVITGDTAATGAQFQTGTGTTCGTGTVNKTGVMLMVQRGSIAIASPNALFTGTGGAAICLAATTGAVTGFISYNQR